MVLIQKRKPENALTLYCRHLKETKKFGRKIITNKDSNLTVNLNPRVRVPQQHMRAYQIITVGGTPILDLLFPQNLIYRESEIAPTEDVLTCLYISL